jgi:mono/diheme cytochrome c family protein
MFRHRVLLLSLLLIPSTAAVFALGCGDDDDNVAAPTPDGGPQAQPDSSTTTDGAAPGDAGADAAEQVARGNYLVNHVGACPDCHTPRTETGAFDSARFLAGVECFIDGNGPADGGCLSSANLTNHETGLKNRTDAQIKRMFLDGKRPDDSNLSPEMPYWVFHNMTTADADAIVAYLRTIPGVDHRVPAAQAPFDNVPAAATPVDPAKIPPATGASAEHGRYLAGLVGPCIECHTPEAAAATPRDLTKAFAGGRHFPKPPFPKDVYTANLTPHATGLAGWTAQDIVKVLKQGKDRDGGGVCPPMPVGPMGAFGGLTDQDALDIATYITQLPPIDNAIPGGNGSCVFP